MEVDNTIINSLVHWTCDDENDEKAFAKTLSNQIKKKLLVSHFKKQDFFKYLNICMQSIEEPFGGVAIMSSTKTFEKLLFNFFRPFFNLQITFQQFSTFFDFCK